MITKSLTVPQATWLLPQLEKRYAYMTEEPHRSKHKYTKHIASTILKLNCIYNLADYTPTEKLMMISCINENIDSIKYEPSLYAMAKEMLTILGYYKNRRN
jgi:hypothetical protein